MRPDTEMSAWQPDDEPRRPMPWGTILAGASLAALATALVLLSPRAPAQERPYYLVLQICGYDPETDRYTRDCAPVESSEPATWSDCKATAQWHHETSPAGVRVVASACLRTPSKQSVEVAKR